MPRLSLGRRERSTLPSLSLLGEHEVRPSPLRGRASSQLMPYTLGSSMSSASTNGSMCARRPSRVVSCAEPLWCLPKVCIAHDDSVEE